MVLAVINGGVGAAEEDDAITTSARDRA